MITKKTIKYINKNIKFSIHEYLPIKDKVLLYDYFLFTSIITETPCSISKSDIDAFKKLKEYCTKLDLDIEKYIGIAYTYINKYHSKSHKIPFSYLLNEKVMEFCCEKLYTYSGESLLYTDILSSILATEKSIRDLSEDKGGYIASFNWHLKNKRINDYFLAYKKYSKADYMESITLNEYFNSLIDILEPIFIYFMSKYNIYNANVIDAWNNSKIEEFSFCPIMFKDRYILKQLPEAVLTNEASKQGSKVHKVLENVFKKYLGSIKSKPIEKIYNSYINSKEYKTLEIEEEHANGIRDFFLSEDPEKGIFKHYINSNIEVLLEHTMTDTYKNIKFYGTADLILIDRKNNTGIIIDYKTSKLTPKWLKKNNEKYLKQLSLYAKLLKLEYPFLTDISGIIFYTRGLIHKFDSLTDSILDTRIDDINIIKTKFKINNIEPNKQSCFLCRHPDCPYRSKASIWDSEGNRITN